jgi:hypothetical protein
MDRRIAAAQRMCDAQNRLAILISAPKINTLGGCEYPTASSSHSDTSRLQITIEVFR